MSFNPSEPRVPKGSPGGGRWGAGGGSGKRPTAPRSAAAAQAQRNPKAIAMHDKLVATPPAQRGKYLQSLSDADLELLTEALYGTPTSDPQVVQARIAVANEMGRRGLDIKKYGALGGGPATPARRLTPAQHRAVAAGRARLAAAKPTPAAAPAAPAPRLPTTGFKNRAV